MSAREALEAFVVHDSDEDAEEYTVRIDNHAAEVLRDAAAKLVRKYGVANRAAGDLRRWANEAQAGGPQ